MASRARQLWEKRKTEMPVDTGVSATGNNARDAWEDKKRQLRIQNADKIQKVSAWADRYKKLTSGDMGYSAAGDIDSLVSDYENIKGYADQFGMTGSQQAVDELKKYREYLSGFESEDHYRVLNMSADELKAELDKGESPVAYTTKDGYNFTWQGLYDDAMQRKDLDDKVTKLSANADWDSLGSYTSEDMLADYQSLYGIGSQNVPMSREEAQRLGYDRRQYEALQDERRKISEKYGVDLSDHDAMTRLTNSMREIAEYTDEMTEDEKAVLSQMFRTEGAQAALDWFDSRRYLYEGRKAGTIRKENAEYSKQNGLIKGSLRALGNTMLSPLEYLVDTMRFAGTDEKYYNMQAVGSAGYKQGVTDKYDWKVGNADAFDFLYNTGMSMVESRVAGTIGGPFASMALGLSAGSQAANDAFERGMDKKHAVATGIAAAIAEMLFESFSIGNFEALKEIPSANLKDIGRNIANSMLVNATEEKATELANLAYDDLINGDFSQWETEYRQNIANGMTPEQAKAKAWGSARWQVAEAGLSGALMGVGFGALGSTPALGYNAANAYNNYRNQSAIAKDILQTDGGVAQLQEAAQQAEAPQLQDKLDKQSAKVTEKATKGNVRRLYNTLGKAYSQQDVSQISQTLESKGVDSQISQELAQAIVDNSQQKILTDKQSNLLFEHIGSKAVQDTLQETTGNAESEVSQRRATLKGMEGVNAVTRELTRMGVKKDYAQTIANVVVAQRQQQKLSTQEQGILEAVQKNEKLATAIRYAEDDVDKSVQEVFAGFGERYGGSNQVIADMPQVQKDVFAQVYDPKVNTSGAEFAHAMAAAYALGYKNQNMGDISQLADGALIATLTDTQRQFAWKEGREVAQADADATQQNVDTAYEQSQEMLQQTGQTAKENHTVTTKGIDVENMDEAQRASYDLAERIAPSIKAEIVVYNGGKEWGRYDHNTDTIHLNANAKWQEKTMMAFTLAHELVHRAKLGSPKQFGAFADFLMEQYGKQGSDVDAMIAEQMDAADRFDATAAEKDKIHMTEDAAFEEVICDACQRMLLDTNAGKKLAQWGAQSQQNKDFLTKVKEIIESILQKLRAAYKGVRADSLAGQEFAKFDRNTRKILADMFVDMSIDAGEKLSTIKEAVLLDQLNKNTAQEGGEKQQGARSYKLPVMGDKQSATTLTKQDLRELLQKASAGDMNDGTYFPVRTNTPDILLQFIKRVEIYKGVTGKELERAAADHPMVIPVVKARQAMAIASEWYGEGDAHEFAVEDVINIIQKMDTPRYLVYEESTGRYIEIVNYVSVNGNKAVAVVEVDEYKGEQHMNGYDSDRYSVLVTLFPPDGKDRISALLNNRNNIVYDVEKKKGNSQVTSGILVPSVLTKSPFAPSLAQDNDSVKGKTKLSVGEGAYSQQQVAKDSLVHYREALRDQKNDTRVMEKEFARLARVFETQARRSGKKDVDIADLKTALKAEAKKHRADQKVWEAEFMRLLRAYETAGRQIERLEETIARQRQAAKDKLESRRKTEMRHKIIRFKEKLQSTLQRPTDNSFVPVDLIGAMVDVCELIDTDSPLYKADGSINKAQQVREQTKERLQALKDEYEKLKTKSDPIYAGEFDETVYAYIDELRQNFAGKSLTDMSLAELGEMYEILRSIDETLQDARRLIDFGEKVDVYEAGDAIITEQKGITRERKNGRRTAAERARDANFNYTLSPVRNVERMSAYHGDSFLLKLFKKFEQGIRKKNKFTMDAYKLFEKLTAGKEYEQAMYSEVGGKKYEDVNGRRFGISKMQMMQAVLSFEREAANGHNHIQKGGFTFADIDMLKKGKLKEAISEEFAHRVPAAVELVESFTEILKNDKWCQQYMEAARSFFNGMAKDAINETSVAWKHRIVAKEKSYIPYEVDKNFVVSEISAANNIQETINAYGMLKATQDHAPQPLIITGLNNILDRHIEKVGAVYGLAIPVRNFNKVWNMRSNSISGNPTVKSMIQLNWGNEGVKHIEQAVQDIQGARSKNQSALYQRVKSGYIGATFLLNLSVVTKQIGSLFAATSMLKWRGPVRMIWNLGSTMINHKKIAAEVDRFTASAWLRRQGVSDAELHTLMTQAQKPGFFKWLSKAPAWLNPTKWISAMDHAVALSLWKYAKADTAKRTGLRGEELLQATAEFYDEVIESTQSMTDVLHRPEVQKRGDVASDAFGMFKTDLYQMAGQLQMAAGRFAANKNGENGRTMGRTVYAIAMSAIWGQLMTTLFALLRYKVNPYRDEEDKDLTVESWLKRQGYALAGDLLGYIFPLLGGEAVGFFENIAYGESEDFADSIALTAVNDLYDIMVTVGSSIKDGEMPKQSDLRKIATKALQIMGVPANNILRTLDAVRLHAQDIANGEFFSFEAGVQRTAANHTHRIVEAAAAGNADIAQGLYEEAVEDIAVRKSESGEAGEEERKEARSELQSALGTKYKDGEVSAEVVEQILADFLGKTEDDIYWLMDKWNYAKENGSTEDYAKYEKFFTAVQTGEQLRKVVKEYTDNGVEEKTLKSQITSHFKPMWVHMSTSERGKIRGYLVNAFVMLGDTREEAIKKINNWK